MLFGDVSGFTAYIESAETDDEKRDALRALHAIRKEMAQVVRKDFDGVRVQYQGDRVEAIFILPIDDDAGISDEAVHAAISLQSSFEHVLKPLLPQIADLGLAVGVSRGDTIVARLGTRGNRDRICLGPDVLRAERNEEHIEKFEIGISENVRDHLADDLAEQFVWEAGKKCHVATGVDDGKLELLGIGADLNAGQKVYVAAAGSVSTREAVGRAVQPSASHAKDG
jgi:class 3 adenylate cyclase